MSERVNSQPWEELFTKGMTGMLVLCVYLVQLEMCSNTNVRSSSIRKMKVIILEHVSHFQCKKENPRTSLQNILYKDKRSEFL